MAIVQSVELDHVLARYEQGVLLGVHAVDADVVRRDGLTVSYVVRGPRPVTQAELSALVGEYNGALIYQAADAEVIKADRERLASRVVELELQAGLTPSPQGWPVLNAAQVRLGLKSVGISTMAVDAVIAAIADADEREIASIYWQSSPTYTRTHPLIAQLGGALGLTDLQIDTAWTYAATL